MELSRKLLRAEEAERRQIARQLHDEISQLLVAAKLELGSATRRDGTSTEAATRHLDEALERLRDVSRRLRPSLLDDLGLVEALRWLLEEYARKHGVETLFESDAEGVEVPEDVAISCFRVAQKALEDTLRRSGASSVGSRLMRHRGGLLLELSDDGAGAGEPPAGSEPLSLDDRARLVGGSCEVVSDDGGTRVRALFPLIRAGG